MWPNLLNGRWVRRVSVFKTSAFNHSATCPGGAAPALSALPDDNVTTSPLAPQSHSVANGRKSSHLSTTDSTTSAVPRYGPAVLRALRSAPDDFNPHDFYGPCDGFHNGQCSVCRDLLYTLFEEMKPCAAAVPVLPDESERDVSPHRFKAARGMEPL